MQTIVRVGITAAIVAFACCWQQRVEAGDTLPVLQPPSPSAPTASAPPARSTLQPLPPEGPRPAIPPRMRPVPAADGRATLPAVQLIPPAPSILSPNVAPLDLNTALRLAGVQNPELMLARQRVVEAAALRQLAAAQFLPSINGGMNYDSHTGVLQQSNGNILTVNRSALYVGAGANAVAAGTVNIPGVALIGNPAVWTYSYLASKQEVQAREFASVAVRNQAFLATTIAYSELLRAEGARAVAEQVRQEARRVAYLTAAYAQVGEGRQADADRAATELSRREAEYQGAEGRLLVASARLAEVLNIDPSIRLHPTDAAVVPMPVVPDPIPVSELIALSLLQRPELGERRAIIRQALLSLEGARVLPFSPNVVVGFSAGGFGGGSNLVKPVFGSFGGRSDFDAVAYWTIQNMGVGNVALINLAKAHLRTTQYQEIAMLDRIRSEVAQAYARTHARFAQIGTTEEAVRTGMNAFEEDFKRVEFRAQDALPIELLDSFRLLARARSEYLDAIVDYNEAQFELYVSLGQPPANALAHPVPTEGVVPGQEHTAPAPGGAGPSSATPAGAPPAPVAPPPPPPPGAAGAARVQPVANAPAGRQAAALSRR